MRMVSASKRSVRPQQVCDPCRRPLATLTPGCPGATHTMTRRRRMPSESHPSDRPSRLFFFFAFTKPMCSAALAADPELLRNERLPKAGQPRLLATRLSRVQSAKAIADQLGETRSEKAAVSEQERSRTSTTWKCSFVGWHGEVFSR